MKFKTGDWIFNEFELKQIVEMEGDRITSVSSGAFRLSGNSLNDVSFPLDLNIKLISNEYEHIKDKLYKDTQRVNINWPDISRWFVSHWAETCQKPTNREWIQKRYQQLYKFADGIREKVEDARQGEVSGVSIFR